MACAAVHAERLPQGRMANGSVPFAVVAVTVVLGTRSRQASADLLQLQAGRPAEYRSWVPRWW